VNITAAQARTTLFGDTAGQGSVRSYFREVSYGRQDIEGDVFGPFDFAMNGCDTRGMVNTIRPQIPGQFDHYLWYLGSRTQLCGWAGLGEVGNPDNPANDTWYNASFGCVVLVQEPGHNLGGQHSSHLNCGNQIFVDAPEGVCTHEEIEGVLLCSAASQQQCCGQREQGHPAQRARALSCARGSSLRSERVATGSGVHVEHLLHSTCQRRARRTRGYVSGPLPAAARRAATIFQASAAALPVAAKRRREAAGPWHGEC